MRNFDESRKREFDERIREDERRRDREVVPFERRVEASTLLPQAETQRMRERWAAIQSSFVDEPRKAIEDADTLVLSTIKQIQETFQSQRTNLEKQWSRGEDVSTEDLRVCLQQYRDFFDRLLAIP